MAALRGSSETHVLKTLPPRPERSRARCPPEPVDPRKFLDGLGQQTPRRQVIALMAEFAHSPVHGASSTSTSPCLRLTTMARSSA